MSQTSCNGHGLWKAFTRLSPATWKLVWKCWAPPCVKFFHWHANLDRCSIVERLACSIWPNWLPLACSTTPLAPCVTKPPRPCSIWSSNALSLSTNCNSHLLGDLVAGGQAGYPQIDAQRTHFPSPASARDDLEATARMNLQARATSVSATTALIKEEALRWAKAGAHGLRVTLPTTWDVH
jgi:hypothetical protein